MKDIIATYLSEMSQKSQLSGQGLSKSKRIDTMYNIVQDRVYGVKYTKEQKILASKLITKILEEEDQH